MGRLLLLLGASVLLCACGSDEVWSCQNATTTGGFNGSTRMDCENAWVCDTDNQPTLVLDLKCTNTGGTFKCDCLGNGISKGTFTSSDVCTSAPVAVQANEGCDWKVPEDDAVGGGVE